MRHVPWGAFHKVKEFEPERKVAFLGDYRTEEWKLYDNLPVWYREFVATQDYSFVVADLVKIYNAGQGNPIWVTVVYREAVRYAKSKMGVC